MLPPVLAVSRAVALDSKRNLCLSARRRRKAAAVARSESLLVHQVGHDVIGYRTRRTAWLSMQRTMSDHREWRHRDETQSRGHAVMTIGRGALGLLRPGQRPLWQPVMAGFARTMSIGEVMRNESPMTPTLMTRPTISVPRGSCTSIRTAPSINGHGNEVGREFSSAHGLPPSIPPMAMSDGDREGIVSSSTLATASSSKRCK